MNIISPTVGLFVFTAYPVNKIYCRFFTNGCYFNTNGMLSVSIDMDAGQNDRGSFFIEL